MADYPASRLGTVSNSEGKTLLRCEQKFVYKHVMNLTSKRPPLPLHRGSWMHQLLHAFYTGEDWKALHAKLSFEYDRLFDEEKDYYGDLPTDLARTMSNYLWTWKDEPWEPIVAELKLEHELPNGWVYRGRLDLIVKDGFGDHWLIEHKTTSHTPPTEVRLMDPQTHRYFWVLRDEYNLKGIIYNYIRTKPPTVPELLKSGELTRRQNIDTTYRTYLSAIKAHHLDPRDYEDILSGLRHKPSAFCWRYRAPRHRATLNNLVADLVPMTERMEALHKGQRPLRAIDFRCNMDCEYRDLCLVELGGGDGKKIIKYTFVKKEIEDDEIEDES